MTAPRRVLGASGIEVSPVGLGTSTFGWTVDRAAAFGILDAYLDHGGSFVDTAPSYSQWVTGSSGGESESLIGDWLRRRRGRRDEIVLATKVGKSPEAPGTSAASIRRGVERSLKRLRTDHVDVFYVHLDDSGTPIDETMLALDRLLQAGKVRAIGEANFRVGRIGVALAAAYSRGTAPFSVAQHEFSLLSRHDYENALRRVIEQERIGFVAHSSLAKGFLSGKYARGMRPAGPAKRVTDVSRYFTDDCFGVVDVVRRVAERRGATVAQVALAWTLAQRGVASVLVSARTTEQVHELMGAGEVDLLSAELAQLTAASHRAEPSELATPSPTRGLNELGQRAAWPTTTLN